MIIELKEKPEFSENIKIKSFYDHFQVLLNELRMRNIPLEIIQIINQNINDINTVQMTGIKLKKILGKKQTLIFKLLENKLKIVPKGYYQNYWAALGISVYGLPFGVVFGLIIMNNIAFMGIGLPIGLAIGYAIGMSMDKKASKEGRQLSIKANF